MHFLLRSTIQGYMRKRRSPRTKSITKRPDNSTSRRPAEKNQGIGARVHFLRRQRGMTLEELSSASKLTKSFVSKIERGLSVPSISTAMRVAESFGLTVSQLLGEEGYAD